MLQRLGPGRHCLLILLTLTTLTAIGLRGEDVGAQATPGGVASPEGLPPGTAAGKPVDCGELAGIVQQERAAISREMGQIKREIAALRDDLSKPGIREIFAGIGYIFGLAGIGLYFHCRKSKAQAVPRDGTQPS